MKYKILLSTLILSFFTIAWNHNSDQHAEPEPQSLKAIMQLLMMDMHTVSMGIYLENYEVIYSGGKNINSHPGIIKEEQKELADILGVEMNSFHGMDMVVHHHADSIAMAAKEKDMQKVLHHYQIVQNGCVSCHVAFRDRILEAKSSVK
ncbi:MAG: hypothetical protein WC967_15250 [Balneolaceae bacterium]